MSCPDENVLGELARGELNSDTRAEVEAHLHECELCSDVVAQLAQIFASSFSGSQDAEPSPDPDPSLDDLGTTLGEGHPEPAPWSADLPLPEGAKLGRYVVLRVIGAGAMGIVYAAYDPQLDRRVAVKLLRRSLSAASLDASQSLSGRNKRLLREAQALARLTHPNAITVHDVGTWEGQVFLAMEFVEGGTLTDWLRSSAEDRAWRDVRRVFRQAGEGLAAAHEAGLVHRDFKPDNVLLHDSGRAVVTDFGLARPLGSAADEPLAAEPISLSGESGGVSALSETLTQTGALVGTPAYMAPEQLEGRRCDAQSDQFAFCVALYEGLYGGRPFQARSISALITAIHDQRLSTPSRGSDVPRWLRRVVLRGLRVQPEDRHPDMRSLLDALRGKRLGTWQSVTAMGLLSVAAGASTVVVMRSSASPPPAYCDDVAAKLDGVWDDDTRRTLHETFAGSSLAFAEDAATRVSTRLDDYADRWIEVQTDACRSEIDGREPAGVVAVRMTCLAQRRSTLGAMSRALVDADADAVVKSIDAVQTLPSPRDCADVSALGRSLPPVPEDEREAVDAVRGLIDESGALRALGKPTQSLDKSTEADQTARTLGYGPVRAEARLERAITLHDVGELAASEQALHEALTLAIAHDHDRTLAQAAASLAHLEDARMAPPVEIERWVRVGQAALDALGGEHPERRASLGASLGNAQRRAGDLQGALATLREVLALRESHYGPKHYTLAEPLTGIGMTYARLGDRERSIEHIERARTILHEIYGDQHPNYAVTLQNLATTQYVNGYYGDALELYRQSHRLFGAGLGQRHPSTAVLAYNLGMTLSVLERYDEGLRFAQEAQSVEDEVHGPRSRVAAITWSLIGELHLGAGRLEEAERVIGRAIEILAEVEPEDEARRANYDSQLALVLLRMGRPGDAEAKLTAALPVIREDKGEPSIDVAEARGRLAMVYLAQGELALAREMIDASVEQYEASDPDPHQHAQAWFRRAQILEAQGDRAAGRAQAERARAVYAERADQPARLQRVTDWLRSAPGLIINAEAG